MAISPPSDIVLDVARAADPSAVAEARAELLRRARDAGASFDAGLAAPGTGTRLSRNADAQSLSETSKKFESMVLQTFIASMMPQNAEGTYGKGIAGDMWKSLMAEKVAEVVAERGGIGIAENVLGDFQVVGEARVPLTGVTSEAAFNDGNHPQAVTTALLDQFERRMTEEIGATARAEASGVFAK